MRFLLALPLLLVARAGPDTATAATIASPACRLAVAMNAKPCPATVVLEIAHELPDPGHAVGKAEPGIDRKAKRIVVDLELARKDGAWPQVVVPTKTKVDVGVLAKGRYAVEVRIDGRLAGTFVLDAR